MEAQQPYWREEEAQYSQSTERDVIDHPEKTFPAPVELNETSIAAEGILLQAERVSEHTAGSPEEGSITEKELEQRHEVQDDAGDESQAVSVGEVLAEMPIKKSSTTTVPPAPRDAPSVVPPQAPFNADDADAVAGVGVSITYAQAVRVGFVTAVLLIVAFVVVQLFV